MDHAQIINQLLCLGLCLEPGQAPPQDQGGDLVLLVDGRAVCPPLGDSPWSLEAGRLRRDGKPVEVPVEVLPAPAFSAEHDPSGAPL
ncbi:MAG: hypothetical protein KJ921_07470, partial [Proteobacteria bacterium]|nr:hypothetical protein [Pseudomonadota bacterium]